MVASSIGSPFPGSYTTGSRLLLWTIILLFVLFFLWSYFAVLDEVAVGSGKVIPSSKEQIVQSLEGGIISEIDVREGDIVEQGQQLAVLDQSLVRSTVEEVETKIRILAGRAARVQAEINNANEVLFPEDVLADKTLSNRELELFYANRTSFAEAKENLQKQLELARKELSIVVPLLARGATNEIEILRLKQKVAEINAKLNQMSAEYYVKLKKEYSDVLGELEPLINVRDGRLDQLRRTTISSPTRGIVKNISISTIGGVVTGGGKLMEIIPLDDQLLIEARLSPRDIAFIRPGQAANVKITAYDYAIYGTLAGKVDRISPDTIQDEIEKGNFYYRVYVVTDHAYLQTKDGRKHPIIPGMIVTSEIHTGSKTVLDYMIKPLNRAREALRER